MALVIADDVLASAELAAGLVTSTAVRARWDAESSCAGMTVGGLAHHLAAQVDLAGRLLQAPPHDEPPISIEEHYRRAAWVHAGLDEEANTVIRDSANEEALPGHDALVEQVRGYLAVLRTPEFPDGAVRQVVALLAMLAVRRHGQTALVRALSRPQRGPASVSAF